LSARNVEEAESYMPAIGINGGRVSGDDRIERGPKSIHALIAREPVVSRIVALSEATAIYAFRFCH
jgi:hypothetical protein